MKYEIQENIEKQLKSELNLSSDELDRVSVELGKYPRILNFLREESHSIDEIRLIAMGLIHGQGNYISQYLFKPENVVLEELKHIDEIETWEVFLVLYYDL